MDNSIVECALDDGSRLFIGTFLIAQSAYGPNSERLRDDLGIATIVNLAKEASVSDRHRDHYREYGIDYISIPFGDQHQYADGELDGYIDTCLRRYDASAGEDIVRRNVLFHCMMGQNRSAFIAGTIMWTYHRQWESPEEMIDWMRLQYSRDRPHEHESGNQFLNNRTLYTKLCEWCQQQK